MKRQSAKGRGESDLPLRSFCVKVSSMHAVDAITSFLDARVGPAVGGGHGAEEGLERVRAVPRGEADAADDAAEAGKVTVAEGRVDVVRRDARPHAAVVEAAHGRRGREVSRARVRAEEAARAVHRRDARRRDVDGGRVVPGERVFEAGRRRDRRPRAPGEGLAVRDEVLDRREAPRDRAVATPSPLDRREAERARGVFQVRRRRGSARTLGPY